MAMLIVFVTPSQSSCFFRKYHSSECRCSWATKVFAFTPNVDKLVETLYHLDHLQLSLRRFDRQRWKVSVKQSVGTPQIYTSVANGLRCWVCLSGCQTKREVRKLTVLLTEIVSGKSAIGDARVLKSAPMLPAHRVILRVQQQLKEDVYRDRARIAEHFRGPIRVAKCQAT
jgi:hypothetical protein